LAFEGKRQALTTRISIGMPVFNGEKFIKSALDSILSQTYQNFELVISDNASTDRTSEICREYASKDERIRYYRNVKNIGGPKNYNRVFEISKSEYFKWAAYDDVLAPKFLEKCVSVLDSHPSAVGCFCKTGRIDENGKFIGYHNENALKNLSSIKAHVRFRDLLGMYYITTPFHGLYRSSSFARSQLHGSYIGADRNLVAELSLMGRIYEIPECLFFWREHLDSYTSIFYGNARDNSLERLKKEISWWSHEGGTYFPHFKNMLEYVKSVNRFPLNRSERLLCYGAILDWVLREGRRFFARDILLFMLQHSILAEGILQNTKIFYTDQVKSKITPFIDLY
jgi:glycosyltransferase involved in cell wall biosynthesis